MKRHILKVASSVFALLFVSSAWANLPQPFLGFEFEGNSNCQEGQSFSWGWNYDALTYVDSLREGKQSAVIGDGNAHPGSPNGYELPGEFSVMAYVCVTDSPNKGVIASFGDRCGCAN